MEQVNNPLEFPPGTLNVSIDILPLINWLWRELSQAGR
jgi:hypothetical protein